MEAQENNQEKTPEVAKKKSPVFLIILAVMIAGAAYFGISKYMHGKYHEETDDAQVEANISPVISKISGYVATVKVKDNQYVQKGDTLLILDQKDLLLAVAQAKAAVNIAQNNVVAAAAATNAASKSINAANAAVGTATAQIEAAKVTVWRTTQDLQRYENLIKDHSITQQQYEQALAAKQSADKQLHILQEQKKQVATQTNIAASQTNATSSQIGVAHASVQQKNVDLDNAKNNLSYTVIVAQEAGYVSKIPVQAGQFVQAGAQLFAIILHNDKWVVANFKETQISRIAEGQEVDIKVDAFPDHTFKGTVSSFAPTTGAKMALLPPDNASGNFVKVVQRLPVKISFSGKQDALISKLRAGMNVFVDVHLN